MNETEELLNKYKLALFVVIRSFKLMQKKIEIEKTKKEINEMSYEAMCSILNIIDYDEAKKSYEEGKGKR